MLKAANYNVCLYQVGQKNFCSHLRLVPIYRFLLSAADSKMFFVLLATVTCAPSTRTMSRLTREHIRVLVNFHWRETTNARQTAERINAAYGEKTISKRGVQKIFNRFASGVDDFKG